MYASSFPCALRRFLAIPGPALRLWCDRHTNFVGAKTEIDDALAEMDKESVANYQSEQGCGGYSAHHMHPTKTEFWSDRYHRLHLRCHAVGVRGAAADPRAPCHLDIRSGGNSQCPPDHSLTVGYRRTSKRKRQSLTRVLPRTPISQIFQSRYVTPGLKPFSYLPKYFSVWLVTSIDSKLSDKF